MSEDKSRFKIKNGEIEIEYEGPIKDANERYKEAFDWLKSIPHEAIGKKMDREKKEGAEEKKKGTRGREIWSPAIDALIKEGFFKLPKRRTTKEVLKALEDKALPTQDKGHIISVTLTRKVRRGDLKGTKSSEGWTFWTE
jgi:hypothetical protein